MRSFIVGIFIAAARAAAKWPKPHRELAREALCMLDADDFEDGIALAVN